MHKKIKKFEVRLTRTVTQYLRVEVQATNEQEAKANALDKAGSLDFHEGTTGNAEYDTDEVEEVQPKDDKPIHCPECAKERGVAIPAVCPHYVTKPGLRPQVIVI